MSLPTTHPAKDARQEFHLLRVFLPLVACLVLTLLMTYALYSTTQRLFRASINERLLALASMAAIQFEPTDLDHIHGPESVSTDVYMQIVRRLRDIRRVTRRVRYAYILRRTEDPFQFEFVADADSLEPDRPVDLNGDGVIDDADTLVRPGDPYDVRSFPEFRAAAFERAFVDRELTHDQWGTFLSGTAPIQTTDSGATRYVLGLDLDVSEFESLTNRAFWPFVGFIAVLMVVIAGLTTSMAFMWRRQVDQLKEIDRQKDELIGIVSHQLGGPITAIKWGLEELHDGGSGALSSSQIKEVRRLLNSTNGLADLTSLLLDVSRIELGRLLMECRPTNLTQLFDDLIVQARPQAEAKSIDFQVELPRILPEATIDPRLTRMAIDNLLSNAIKYTPERGRVSVTIETSKKLMRCRVSDTGIGIPVAEQSRVFGKLYRATNARDVEGHGFGLYVAKGAIEQQGGHMSFTSREGFGTTFELTLPLD